MKKITIFSCTVLCMLAIICNGQNHKDTVSFIFKNAKVSPCLISDSIPGVNYYYSNLKMNADIRYVHRFIVVPKGKSYTFYFDKLIIDVSADEDEEDNIEWTRKLDCKTLLKSLNLDTDTVILSDVNWFNSIAAYLKLNGKYVKLLIDDKDNIKVMLCDEVDLLFIKLDLAYIGFDSSKLASFVDKWHKDSKIGKTDNVIQNEKTKNIYDIFETFYNSQKSSIFNSLDLNRKKYIIIQNSIKYSILSDEEITNYDYRRKYEYISISNFRPKLDFGKKKQLYLIDNYETALMKFLCKDFEPNAYMEDSKSRGAFLGDLISIETTHWDDSWCLHPYMFVSAIDINNEFNKAIVHFSRNYSGGEILFEKENGVWFMKKMIGTWIE